jgi:predicted dienelactone hydrolase
MLILSLRRVAGSCVRGVVGPVSGLAGKLLVFCAVVPCLLCFAVPGWTMGAGESEGGRVGLHILNAWEEDSGSRVAIYVWYPTIRPERAVFLEPYTISAAREGMPEEGKFPVILLSHAAAESGLSHHDTAEYLARKGFVVIAPTHPGDNYLDTSRIYTEHQVTDRPYHLQQALAVVAAHPELGPIADMSNIGVIGYGAGAAGAMLLAGAVPDPAGLRTYCARAGENDPYCSGWAHARLARFMEKTPQELLPVEGRAWQDPRVKCLALLAPGYGMLFTAQGVASMQVPAVMIEAEQDTMNVPDRHARYLRTLLPENTSYFILSDATSFTLHSVCSERMQANYPAICRDSGSADREAVHKAVNDILLRFFGNKLQGKAL